MQWQFFLLLAAANVALARMQGHERRHINAYKHAHRALEGENVEAHDRCAVVTDIKTVTVYTTVFGDPPAEPTASIPTTTVLVPAPAPTTTPTTATHPEHSDTKPKPDPAPNAPPNWTEHPPNNEFTTAGFGARTLDTSGSRVTYRGNIGSPWGSNIIRIPATSASNYKYVLKMTRSTESSKPWTVTFWNKVGPSGQLDGWYGHSALTFTLGAHESAYVAFDENSQGAWGAAEGTTLPKDKYGGYSCTWGEFDFGNAENGAWSGWDVSAIQAQEAGQVVQGMRICDHSGKRCSYVTEGAREVVNAYTRGEKKVDGIGGNRPGGPVRLEVLVDYKG